MSEPKFTIRYDSHGTQLEGVNYYDTFNFTHAQREALSALGFHYFPLGKLCEGQYSDYWQAGYSVDIGELEFILGPCAIQNESAEDYQARQKGA